MTHEEHVVLFSSGYKKWARIACDGKERISMTDWVGKKILNSLMVCHYLKRDKERMRYAT